MRKFISFLLCAFIILSCGCSVAETPNDDLNENNGEVIGDMTNEDPSDVNTEENVESGMYIDSDAGILLDIDHFDGFYEGSLIYESSSDEFNSSDGGSGPVDFYKYNIGTGESKYLGTNVASYASGDVAYIGGKMYLYSAGTEFDENNQPMAENVFLMEFDFAEESFRVVARDSLGVGVVYFESCGDHIISFKSGESSWYIDRIAPQAEDPEFETIICLTADTENENATWIEDFSVYNEEIYVLCCSISLDDTVSYCLNVYDVNGALQRNIPIDSEISSDIYEVGVFDFKVFENYVLIASYDDYGYVLKVDEEGCSVTLKNLRLRASSSAKITDDIYLYSIDSDTVWKYDKQSDKLLELSGKFDGITYMSVCDDDIIVHANSNNYYFPDGSFIVEE